MGFKFCPTHKKEKYSLECDIIRNLCRMYRLNEYSFNNNSTNIEHNLFKCQSNFIP